MPRSRRSACERIVRTWHCNDRTISLESVMAAPSSRLLRACAEARRGGEGSRADRDYLALRYSARMNSVHVPLSACMEEIRKRVLSSLISMVSR